MYVVYYQSLGQYEEARAKLAGVPKPEWTVGASTLLGDLLTTALSVRCHILPGPSARSICHVHLPRPCFRLARSRSSNFDLSAESANASKAWSVAPRKGPNAKFPSVRVCFAWVMLYTLRLQFHGAQLPNPCWKRR